MTVKSPFYNIPSTSTSVDACHKCPLIQPETQVSTAMSKTTVLNVNKVQQNESGIDHSQVSAPSTNNLSVVEPSNSSVAKSDIGSAAVTSCSNCGTTTTPLWRRSPLGETICNACGLYYKARNTTRPPWLKRNALKRPKQISPIALAPRISPAPLLAPAPLAPAPPPIAIAIQQKEVNNRSTEITPPSTPPASEDGSALICANCHTTTTPLWRRDEMGQPICNACGLYFKLHSVHRPITMKRSTIKRRKRVTAATLVTRSVVHRQISPPAEEINDQVACGSKRRIEQISERPTKRIEHLRPLLPSPSSNVDQSSTRSSPDPIEPEVFHQPYLPSPPMKPTKNTSNIACLLNPEVDRSERALPSLPSPPLLAQDMMPLSPKQKPSVSPNVAALASTVSALFNPIVADHQRTHKVLEAHRNELKREVNNLTSLLSRTTAMLQNIDQVMAVSNNPHSKWD